MIMHPEVLIQNIVAQLNHDLIRHSGSRWPQLSTRLAHIERCTEEAIKNITEVVDNKKRLLAAYEAYEDCIPESKRAA